MLQETELNDFYRTFQNFSDYDFITPTCPANKKLLLTVTS